MAAGSERSGTYAERTSTRIPRVVAVDPTPWIKESIRDACPRPQSKEEHLARYLRTLKTPEAQLLLPRRAGLLPRVFPVLGRVEAIVDAMGRLDRDPTVRCAIVTGAGKAFSSGGNLKHMKEKSSIFGTPKKRARS